MHASADTPECKLSRGCRAQLQLQQEGQVLFDSHDKGGDIFHRAHGPKRKTHRIADNRTGGAGNGEGKRASSSSLLQTVSRSRSDTGDELAEEMAVAGGEVEDDEEGGGGTAMVGLVAMVETEMALKAIAAAAVIALAAAAVAEGAAESVQKLAGLQAEELQQSCFLDVEGEGGGRTYIDEELDDIFGDEPAAAAAAAPPPPAAMGTEQHSDGEEDEDSEGADDDWMTCEDPTGTLTESSIGGYAGFDDADDGEADGDLLGVYGSGGGGGTRGGGDDWVGSEGGGMSFKVDCVVYGDVVLAIRHLTHELSVTRLLKSAAAESSELGPVHTAETMFKASFHTGKRVLR
jgi:hypothetical protein